VTRLQKNAKFFEVLASGHHGYPQPQDDYLRTVYETACLRCGIHGRQIHPFRVRKSPLAPHSAFLQLNWVFDAFFVHPKVADILALAGITGIGFGPVVDHRTGREIDDRVQLLIETIVSCAETTRLFAMTCRPDNEEIIRLRGRFPTWKSNFANYPPETYCGRLKHHRPTAVGISNLEDRDLPDVFQTEEWFGSGAGASRLTLASERLVEVVQQLGWRGVEFRSAEQGGYSERICEPRPVGPPKLP
jgi:hypothetical protein